MSDDKTIEAIRAQDRTTDQRPACKRCGGTMRPGVALEQTWKAGIPDFHDQEVGVTLSPGGSGKLINCMKCDTCGWSVTTGEGPPLQQVAFQ